MPQPPALSLLLEIGAEELPSSFVDAALAALPKIVADELANARLSHGEVRALGTPRRLAVVVRDVADAPARSRRGGRRPARDRGVQGRQAHEGRRGVRRQARDAPSSRSRSSNEAAGPKQKAGRYVVGRRVEQGRPASELLGAALAGGLRRDPVPQIDALGRPRRDLRPARCSGSSRSSASEVVGLAFAGVRSGRSTRGHRFLAPGAFDVASPDDVRRARSASATCSSIARSGRGR